MKCSSFALQLLRHISLLAATFVASPIHAQVAFDQILVTNPGKASNFVTGDVNGDGAPDIIVPQSQLRNGEIGLGYGETIAVFLNDGLGNFLPPREYPAGFHPFKIDLGDFDDDGDLDVVLTNSEDEAVSILFNNGNGRYLSRNTYNFPAGFRPKDIATLDWNGDGALDVFVFNDFSDPYYIVLVNDGNALFSQDIGSDIGRLGANFAETGDFNLDGFTDTIAANGDPTTTIVLSNGEGGILDLKGVNTRLGSHQLAVTDFDNDGYPDVVLTEDFRLLFYRNDGLANFSFATLYAFPEDSPNYITALDVNNNGVMDFAASTYPEYSGLSVFLGSPAPRGIAISERVHFNEEDNPGPRSFPGVILTDDLNRDGLMDIVMYDGGIDSVRVYINRTALSPLTGTVEGVLTRRVTCKNVTSGQSVTLTGARSEFSCDDAGLVTTPGDRVSVTIAGQVADPELLSGGTRGISDSRRVGCSTPGKRAGVFSMQEKWRCSDLGLVLNAGDIVYLRASGVVR